ncbi:hypothetical protein G5I_02519 [Acromyrmex echinatior]|uniref:Uncharacterized protein n=1 Tax=Acromyrmex echinatior TaxID=103372 RepID=F4WAI2_ACREC|nr:hypothetical protein G5I_02519 [Acromyrmex echinatior]
MPATYISKKLPSGNKAFCILARSNDVGIFRDESSGAFTFIRPSHPDSRSNRALANAPLGAKDHVEWREAVPDERSAELREDSHNSSIASPPVLPRPYTFLCS